MSGIFGIYNFDKRPADLAELNQIAECLAHRGPDGSGIWHSGPVGLVHRMLWTTPESLHEQQPLLSSAGDLVLTADARIDNRAELISRLALNDLLPNELSDGTLILKAYQKWGEECAEKLIGDFAFAIWDSRRQEIFCARGPMGVKPFYYFRSPSFFVFASEIKAILQVKGVPRHLNELMVADYLVRVFEDKAITFYQQIYRLPPAHCMSVSPQEFKQRSYWALDPYYETRLGSDREYEEAFRDVFTLAVKSRLRSAYEVGSTLSGGLDSSSIAITARNLRKQDGTHIPFKTFSAIFPSLPQEDLELIDERSYIKAVLAGGGFASHIVRADLLSPLKKLEELLWRQDEAFFAPNLYMHWALYSAAHQQGVRIFLDGIDGDVTVSYGLESLADLARSGRWKALYREAQAISRQPGVSARPRKYILRYGFKPLMPKPFIELWQIIRGAKENNVFSNTAINKEFAERNGIEKRANKFLYNGFTPFTNARKKHLLSLRSGIIPLSLELLDKTATAFSLEPRYPFYDRRLVEFCLSLPAEQKLSNGWTRSILRRSMEGVLPQEVQWRLRKS
ncbi:MAG: lasso peptide isopeptide bond-forming cyclase, partial [Sedimentisphaerales bacterium]